MLPMGRTYLDREAIGSARFMSICCLWDSYHTDMSGIGSTGHAVGRTCPLQSNHGQGSQSMPWIMCVHGKNLPLIGKHGQGSHGHNPPLLPPAPLPPENGVRVRMGRTCPLQSNHGQGSHGHWVHLINKDGNCSPNPHGKNLKSGKPWV